MTHRTDDTIDAAHAARDLALADLQTARTLLEQKDRELERERRERAALHRELVDSTRAHDTEAARMGRELRDARDRIVLLQRELAAAEKEAATWEGTASTMLDMAQASIAGLEELTQKHDAIRFVIDGGEVVPAEWADPDRDPRRDDVAELDTSGRELVVQVDEDLVDDAPRDE